MSETIRDRLWAAYQQLPWVQQSAFLDAKLAISRALRVLPFRPVPGWHRPFLGLGRRVNGRRPQPEVPFGWRMYREWDRDSVVLLPAWLYYPVRLWQYRWAPMRWLVQLDRYGMDYRECVRGGKVVGRFLEYDEGCYLSTVRPRGWKRLTAWQDDIPRWAA